MSSCIIEIAQFPSTQNELQIAIATVRAVNGGEIIARLFFCRIIHHVLMALHFTFNITSDIG